MYDARFFRMWEFYLAGGIVMFENGAACNYQVQYIRERTALPITRDYMVETERRYREIAAEPAAQEARALNRAGKRSSLRLLELGDQRRRRIDLLQRFLDRVGRNDDRAVVRPVVAVIAGEAVDVAVERRADHRALNGRSPASPNCRR